MDYFEEKQITTRLHEGALSQTAVLFQKDDEAAISDLIAKDLVKPSAFLPGNRLRFGLQNIAEKNPVTAKGKILFNLGTDHLPRLSRSSAAK